ncbi:MAG: acetyltransferase, family [Alphaproteobacteria bacterium]|jgi:GNAT superfamily N-acetyltransferase|nr:acetyltransferase, family [Alphaproteobacteria bacterium]MDB5740881.1 acetyltransferase, family [Alphaproteobacteria bacterium]
MSEISLRPANPADAALILDLLRELAEYEKLLDNFHLTEAIISRDMLGPEAVCKCDILFVGGEPAGITTWFWIYKSFRAARGIFLEDLYVRPEFRGRKLGKLLLANLARRAHAADGYVEWQVLDWNTPSIDFYAGIGAELKPEWITCRLDHGALAEMAS